MQPGRPRNVAGNKPGLEARDVLLDLFEKGLISG
jgi:hypothetical protein